MRRYGPPRNVDDGTYLFALCLGLKQGQCIDVDGETLRRAEMSDSGDYHRQPLPHEMVRFLEKIQANWGVTIVEKFGRDEYIICRGR